MALLHFEKTSKILAKNEVKPSLTCVQSIFCIDFWWQIKPISETRSITIGSNLVSNFIS